MSKVVIESHVGEVKSELDRRIPIVLNAIGMQAEGNAVKGITAAKAVDTGRLRASITHQVDIQEDAVYIGSNVEYAPYVELGTGIYASEGGGRQDPWWYQDEKGEWHFTHGIKPRHFLRNAITNYQSEYENILKEGFK